MKNRMTNKEEEDDDDEEESSGEESLDDDSESDDDSSASESSGDSSLGNIIADMGIPVPAGIAAKKRPNLKLSNSTNNLMTMKLEADIDPSAIENTEQRAALEKFMSRMNTAGNYFQKPEEPSRGMPKRSRSSGDLDDIRKDAENKNNPAILFEEMVEQILPRSKRELLFTDSYWKKFFLPLSEKRRKAYTKESVDAVRDQDLETLERILAREGDSSMEAANAQVWIILAETFRRIMISCMCHFLTHFVLLLPIRDRLKPSCTLHVAGVTMSSLSFLSLRLMYLCRCGTILVRRHYMKCAGILNQGTHPSSTRLTF